MHDMNTTALLERIDPGLRHCRGIGEGYAEEFLRRVPPAQATKAAFDLADLGLWSVAHAMVLANAGTEADLVCAFQAAQAGFLERLQAVYGAALVRPAGHA